MLSKYLARVVCVFFLSLCTLQAQQIGQWVPHLSYHNVTKTIAVGDDVYGVANGDLFAYHTKDASLQTYSKVTGLNDNNIRYAYYSPEAQCLLLIYTNANIDIMYADGNISNLAQLKLNTTKDKTINDISIVGHEAIIAANFGLMVINLQTAAITATYDLPVPVRTATLYQGKLLALTSNGLYVGQRHENLLDMNFWRRTEMPAYAHLYTVNEVLYAYDADGLYILQGDAFAPSTILQDEIQTVDVSTKSLYILTKHQHLVVYTPATQQQLHYALPQAFMGITHVGNRYYAAAGYNGFVTLVAQDKQLVAQGLPLIPNSPMRNYSYFMRSAGDRVLIGGGSLNYTGLTFEGTAMIYNNGRWINFSEDSITQQTGLSYENVTAVAQDPIDSLHHYVSTAGTGLYEFRNYRFVRQYSIHNSPLKTIFPNTNVSAYYVRLNGLAFDKDRNLWMVNNEVDTVLRVLTPQGKWHGRYVPEIAKHPTLEKILIDRNNQIWVTSRRTTERTSAGLLLLRPGASLTSDRDDTHYFRSTFKNQDGTDYPLNQVFDIVEDKQGALWVGTDKGPFVIEKPLDFMKPSFTFTQVKIPRNDGTNFADYLLNNAAITAIAIDGANRKWMGTDASGLYLISADGQSTLQHFTQDNSPLPSNNIYSLNANAQTGEILIGTDAGIISYYSDATAGAEELMPNALHIYPNPVRPNYRGMVTITGLTQDADIKITTAMGKLIAMGTSIGGVYQWDLRNQTGDEVPAGVYYVLIATSDASKGAAAKIVVIR